MSHLQLSGTCHCDSVHYTVKGSIDAFYCHCEHCRLNCAAPYVALGRVDERGFQLTSGTLKTYNSSTAVTWYFCEKCGSGIKYRNTESKPEIDFLLAKLTNVYSPMPSYHIQVQEKLPWITIDDRLPQYLRWRDSSSNSQ